jgi:hypothetical protein
MEIAAAKPAYFEAALLHSEPVMSTNTWRNRH